MSRNTQLRSVIEWEDYDPETLFERWSEDGDEIKNASKLIVAPGQGCVVVQRGILHSVAVEEGVTELKTGNTPFWTTLSRLLQGGESENKVGIWFFQRTLVTDQKFGTPVPVKYQDPVYGFPVGLRCFGNYSFRVSDAAAFFRQVSGTQECYLAEEARRLVNSRLVQPLSEALAESRLSYAEVDANRGKISALAQERVQADLGGLGLEITDFRIDGTSFDDDTMKRINRISDMKAEAMAAGAVGLDFVGLKQVETSAAVAMAAVKKDEPSEPMSALRKLKLLFEQGLITEIDYETRKSDILDRL